MSDFLQQIWSLIWEAVSRGPIFTGWILGPGAPWYMWALGILGDLLIIGGVLFLLLNAIPNRYRKALVIAVTFLAGLIYSVEFFVPPDPETTKNFMTDFITRVGEATNVIYAFALGLGVYSLMRFHARSLSRGQAGWHNNFAFFIAFAVMMLVGFWYSYNPNSILASNIHHMLFQSLVAALGATMFSTIGFFIVSAAYRAFRIRSAEATLMLAAAFVVMLGQVPLGSWLTSGLPMEGLGSGFRLENISYWILNHPNMAAWRAMAFGIEIGALAMALRTWLSLERGSFFDREL